MITESKFKYSREEIKALVNQYKSSGMKPASMAGVVHDLERLRPLVENFYDAHIFYLSYFAADAPYMGWTREEINEMLEITDGITQKFYEIYALILVGLGMDLEET